MPPCSWFPMPRKRSPLLLIEPHVREEDEGTWMLTFSDLVLLLLAFVAIGILMERAHGPHVITDRLQARVPEAVEAPPEQVFALVEETPGQIDPGPDRATPPQVDPESTVANEHLRELAGRLETRIAAEGIPGVRPVVLSAMGITIEVGATAPARPIIPTLPAALPRTVPIVDRHHGPDLGGPSLRERALARTTRLAYEMIAGDPLLAVRAVRARDGEARPARVEIRHAG